MIQEHAEEVSPGWRSYRRTVSSPFSGITGAAVTIASCQGVEGVVNEDFGILNRFHLFMTGPGPGDGEGDGDGNEDGVSGAE